MNKVKFFEKIVFFLVRPETYWVICYLELALMFIEFMLYFSIPKYW